MKIKNRVNYHTWIKPSQFIFTSHLHIRMVLLVGYKLFHTEHCTQHKRPIGWYNSSGIATTFGLSLWIKVKLKLTLFALALLDWVADSMVQNRYGTDLLWYRYRRGIWLCWIIFSEPHWKALLNRVRISKIG